MNILPEPENIVCRNCNSTDLTYLFHAKNCEIHRCGTCGYDQVMPLPSTEEISAIYGKEYFDKGKYVDDLAGNMEQRRRLKLLDRVGVRKGAKLLDFGMASGDFCRSAKADYEMYGVDISEEAIARAKETMPSLKDRLFCVTIDAIPFEDKYFDAVVLWDVIEHLEYPQYVMSLLKKKLKPGGHLIVSTPDAGALTARILKSRWHFMTPPEHLGFFSVKSLNSLMERQGFSVVKTMRKGKWANVVFVLHKFARVFPEIVTIKEIGKLKSTVLNRLCIYVPTNDILYVSGRLNENGEIIDD